MLVPLFWFSASLLHDFCIFYFTPSAAKRFPEFPRVSVENFSVFEISHNQRSHTRMRETAFRPGGMTTASSAARFLWPAS
jgi:hypothetical protein